MNQQIKLIWDFRGDDANPKALRHEEHLKEYVENKNIVINGTGVECLTNTHSFSYMIVEKDIMIEIRDALKPHRGEYLD